MKQSSSSVFTDLGTIRAFMEDGQRYLDESGSHFILWGILIPVATLISLFLEALPALNPSILSFFWPISGGIGAVSSIVIGSIAGKKRRVTNFASTVNTFFWQGFLVAAVLLSIVDLTQAPDSIPLYLSHVSLMLGLAYWIHGSMLGLAWFRRFALVWWLAVPMLAFSDWPIAERIMAGTTFVSAFIPGVLLRVSKKKNAARVGVA